MPADPRSYRSQAFTVANPDARLRRADDLTQFVTWAAGDALPAGTAVGDRRTIADGTRIKVDDTRLLPAGGGDFSLFVHALDAGDGSALGWTSVGNVDGRLIGCTLGEQPPAAGAPRTGPNAAWDHGTFLGQITLVLLVGTGGDIKFIAEKTVGPFLAMAEAARGDGRRITVNSGFRSYPEQSHLYDGFVRHLPGFNRAARPGASNHQNGLAFDLDVKPGEGNAAYEWLKGHATSFGFVRTVSTEPWHWEYQPDRAAAARQRGRFFDFPNGGLPSP